MKYNSGNSEKKVLLLLQKAEKLFRSDIETAAALSARAIEESRASKKKELLAASLAMAGTSTLILEELQQSEEYSCQAKKIYTALGDIDAALDAEHKEISVKLFAGNEKNLLIRLHEILDFRLHTEPQTSFPKGLKEKFFIPRSWQDRLLKKLPSPKQIEKAYHIQLIELYGTLARTYSLIDVKKAISYLEEEISIAERLRHKPYMSRAYNNLGTIYTVIGNHALSRQYLERSLTLDRQMGHIRGEAAVQKNLALLYISTGQISLARKYSKMAIKTFQKLKLWEAVSQTYISLAIYERKYGILSKALEYSTEAWNLLKGREKSIMYYFVLLEHLVTLNAISPSHKYYKKLCSLYEEVKDKNFELQHEAAQEIAKVAQDMRLHSESLKWLNILHEHEIESVKKEQENVIQKIEIQQELVRYEQERKVQKLKNENLELELKAKSRETEFLANQLAKKTSLLSELSDELKSLNASSTVDKAIAIIDSKRFRDHEFEQLEKRVQTIHKDFLMTLAQEYPDLTDAEKKVCILLRVGLKPAEIASILFISKRTVETHCLSIRKKLNIPKKIRLLPYLQEL